jgi:hypothetical protein
MHRIAASCALLVGACSFKADYAGEQYTCTDGVCPAGLVCDSQQMCVVPHDAGKTDGMPDGREAAKTCSDPQPFPATGGTASGTTVGKGAIVSSMCGGLVFNGPEAVYKITTAQNAHLIISITGMRKVYALTACQTLPATPTCEGNMYGTAINPLSVFPTPGTQYIVVDDEVANASSTYGITVTVQ